MTEKILHCYISTSGNPHRARF